jgi:hypothetical protein
MKNPVKSIFRATTRRLEGMESILAIPKENCGVEASGIQSELRNSYANFLLTLMKLSSPVQRGMSASNALKVSRRARREKLRKDADVHVPRQSQPS